MKTKSPFAEEFVQQAVIRINESLPRITQCLQLLTDEQIWSRPNGSSNSIGNLVLHLCGNITQYAIASLGRLEDNRERSIEFSTKGGLGKDQLTTQITDTIQQAAQTLESISEDELLRTREVQCFEMTGIGVIVHVTEHLSYHTGQISYRCKELLDLDLKYYDDSIL